MDRRQFINQTSYLAIGIGAFGSVSLKGRGYQADSITTTDILGPFYRPNAPFRENLNPPDFSGEELHISGAIMKEDGKSPMSNGLIEIWQANSDGFYDNISEEYIYRASQKIKADGTYHFITTKPGPEPVDEKATIFRPAHIHMLISAEGRQDLITQIYFQNDPYLATDPSTKSGLAINRILTVKKKQDQKKRNTIQHSAEKRVSPRGQCVSSDFRYLQNDRWYNDGILS